MSEIRADTISDAAGTGPITLTKQSAAKAWCNYYYSSGVPVVSGSFNVSSIDDSGVGVGGINFTNNFNSIGSCNAVSAGWAYTTWADVETASNVPSAGQVVVLHTEGGAGAGVDANIGQSYALMMNAHGDLA